MRRTFQKYKVGNDIGCVLSVYQTDKRLEIEQPHEVRETTLSTRHAAQMVEKMMAEKTGNDNFVAVNDVLYVVAIDNTSQIGQAIGHHDGTSLVVVSFFLTSGKKKESEYGKCSICNYDGPPNEDGRWECPQCQSI
jgi:hypothetical protein